MDQQITSAVTSPMAKVAPPIVLTGWSFWGFTLNEWAAIAAIVYSVLMTIFLIADRYKRWRDGS